MNNPNLVIDEECSDRNDRIFYLSRINPKLPWPNNASLAEFVSEGKYKKFKILEIGDPNVKVVKLR